MSDSLPEGLSYSPPQPKNDLPEGLSYAPPKSALPDGLSYSNPSLASTIARGVNAYGEADPVNAGLGEAALNVASGVVAPVIGGLAGIGTLAGNYLGVTSKSAADVSADVSNALTYQPKTKIGKYTSSAITYPFEMLSEAGRGAGEKVLDVTGSPIAATVADVGVNAIPFLLGRGKPGGIIPRDTITPEQVDAWTRANPEPTPVGASPAPNPASAPAGGGVVPQGRPFTDADFWEPGSRSLPPPAAAQGGDSGVPAVPTPPLDGQTTAIDPTKTNAPGPIVDALTKAQPVTPQYGAIQDQAIPDGKTDSTDEAKPADDIAPDDLTGESAAQRVGIQELPVNALKLSDDVPQFKSGASADSGVVEPLGGTFDRRGVGPIQVWRRNNGDLEVISGRHRLDLAQRSGEETIPSQVYNESDGFTAQHAASLDAELNIRDGQGKVKDYVQYFQNPVFQGADGKAEAESRGLLARATGQRAYGIATQGDPELIAALHADRITAEAASQIAQAAPNDGRLQSLGMKLIQDGKSQQMAANTMRAVQSMGGGGQTTGDMFGFDDSAIQDGIRMAQVATRNQRDIGERLAAITGATKRPELARNEGIDVRNPQALQQRIAQLRAEKEAWDNWPTDPDKVSAIRAELGMKDDMPSPDGEENLPSDQDDQTLSMFENGEPYESPKDMFGGGAPERNNAQPVRRATTGDLFGGASARDHVDAATRAKDAQRNGANGGRADAGDGGLFDGKRPEQYVVPSVEQRAYHGTPFRNIEREGFKLNKIGSGEGNQAYGHGIYFAGNRDVAEGYRKGLSRSGRGWNPSAEAEALGITNFDNGEFRSAFHAHAASDVPTGIAAKRIHAGSADARKVDGATLSKLVDRFREFYHDGQLYHAEIPEDHELLDWDKPLNEQPEQVRKALAPHFPADGFKNPDGKLIYGRMIHDVANAKEQGWNETLGGIPVEQGKSSPQLVSEYLGSIGIPGLRYLDGGSRRAGEGTHNYVIWDQSRLNNDVTPYYDVSSRVEASRDMFTRTRGDLESRSERHGENQGSAGADDRRLGNGRGTGLVAPERTGRTDATQSLIRRANSELESFANRFDGSILADNIARELRETGTAQLIGRQVESGNDLAALAQIYRSPLIETMRYFFTDAEGRIVGESAVSSRNPSSSAIFPVGHKGAESYLRSIMPEGAKDVWIAHNHPSGNPKPSKEDHDVTRYINDISSRIGLRFRGHIVLNHKRYAFIPAHGREYDIYDLPKSEGEQDPLRQYAGHDSLNGVNFSKGSDEKALIGAVKQIYSLTPKDSFAVIALDTKNKATTISTFPESFLKGSRGPAALTRIGRKSGAHRMIVVGDAGRVSANIHRLAEASEKGLITDAIAVGQSGAIWSLSSKGIVNNDKSFSAFLNRKGSKGHSVYENGDEYATPDSRQEAPARSPGESQRDYARRVMRQDRPAILKAFDPLPKDHRIGRMNFREMLATRDRNLTIADHAFDEARKMFDHDLPEQNLATIDQWETGRRVTDPDARQFFESLESRFSGLIDRIRAHDPDALRNLVENYFPHIWEDPKKARAWYETLLAKNPIRGDRSFLKKRTYGTMKDGIASGLKPVSTNPVDLAIAKLQQMEKYATFLEFRNNLGNRGYLIKVEGGRPAPAGYARVDDPAFSAGKDYWAVPEGLAADINNYLSPGLNRVPGWRALRKFQNTLVSARLGFSMFHAGFTTFDNFVTHADTGVRRMVERDFTGGLSDLLKAFASPVTSPFIEGPRLQKMWTGRIQGDPATAAILNALQSGGARLKMSPTEYNQSLPKLLRAWRQKSARGLTVGDAFSSIGEASSWIIHHWLVPKQKMAARVHLMKYLLDHYAGALGKARGDYLGITQAMHHDTLQQLATHAVDIVDDRLGQMTYDNQFWEKIVLQASQTALMAPGWLVGTTRTVTGGVADIQKIFKPEALLSSLDAGGKIKGTMPRASLRLSGLVTLAVLMSAMNAVTQYLLTGNGPEEAKDYFFPKDGNKNADDSDARIQYPTYWMDHYKLATEPGKTLAHKLNPTWGLLYELANNRDFYGTEIRHQRAEIDVQAKEIASYIGKSFMPFSIQGNERLQQERAGGARKAAAFFGVNPAPTNIDRTQFQDFVAQRSLDKVAQGARTQEDADRSNKMHAAEDAIRHGEDADFGGLSQKDQNSAQKTAKQTVPEIRFRRLSIEDKLFAYGIATQAERSRYNLRSIIAAANLGRSTHFQQLPPDEREHIKAQIQAIRDGSR